MIGCLRTRVRKLPIITLYLSASSQSLRFILSLRLYSCFITSGPVMSLHANSKGIDQPSHPRSLIRAFIMSSLKILKHCYVTISLFYVVSAAEQASNYLVVNPSISSISLLMCTKILCACHILWKSVFKDSHTSEDNDMFLDYTS